MGDHLNPGRSGVLFSGTPMRFQMKDVGQNMMRLLSPGVIATTLAYAALAALGLTLAIPPGYVSPVFPAMGLAVAVTLQFGPRILPGIWLGSLAANLAVAWKHGGVHDTPILVAVLVASGSTLQAWAARALVVRWLGSRWQDLAAENDIARFLAIVGPLSCLVSATIGVSALCATGMVDWAGFAYSWCNWWVGDTLGVLVFVPLTLTFLRRDQPAWKERRLRLALPMLVTLCLVVGAFLGVARWEQAQMRRQVQAFGEKLDRAIEYRLVAHQEALSALRRLMEVSPDMTFRQFEYFTRITLKDNPDIFGLSFNAFIRDPERAAFEKSMSSLPINGRFAIFERDGLGQTFPARVRPHYVVVKYIAPLEGNRKALGYDINSDSVRREAIDKVMISGHLGLTAPLRLVQENQPRVGILALSPAYRQNFASPAEKRSSLFGFAVSVIKVDEMVQIATRDILEEGMVFSLKDAGGRGAAAPCSAWLPWMPRPAGLLSGAAGSPWPIGAGTWKCSPPRATCSGTDPGWPGACVYWACSSRPCCS